MKLKHSFIVLLLTASTRFASGQADTLHFMYSFISVNGGYGVNTISPANKTIANIFWGKSGPTYSVTGLIALKSSYWGIPVMLGYSAPSFALSDYLGGLDTNKLYSFHEISAASYSLYYMMTGINLKMPQRTTREALELHVIVGPILAILPEVKYTFQQTGSTQSPILNDIKSNFAWALAVSPGIGLGYKISHHLAFMANADLLFAYLVLGTTKYEYSNNGNNYQALYMISDMEYLHLTAGLAYTFGRMIPNIAY